MNSENMSQPDPDKKPTNNTWMRRAWDWLASPSEKITDIGEQRSARLASSFLLSITLLDLVGGLARMPRTGLIEAFTGPIGYSFIALSIAYTISRTRWYRAAIFFFSLSFSSLAYVSILQDSNPANYGTIVLIYVPLSLIVASSFISAPAVFLLVGLNIGAYVSIQAFGVSLPENIGAQAGIITVIGVVLMLLTNFRDNTEKIRLQELQKINRELESFSNELENRVETRTQELVAANRETARRSEQLISIAELARSITNIQDVDSLLPTITRFISQRLGYYHVGIFMNDAGNVYTHLRAANSAGGQKMLERGHKLRIGVEGVVGYATRSGQPRIALDVGSDVVYFDNPDLPETHSEMAIPLRIGTEIIGVLDIQSTERNAFSKDDMPVFTTLADQVAVAIQNVRLLTQAETALREIEEAYAEQAKQDWKGYTQSQLIQGYRFDGIEPKPLTKGFESKSDATGLTLPMRLRGQIIGKLKLNTNTKDRKWTDEEIALAEAAINRAALALENARLLEEAQSRASREQAIGEIADRLSRASEVETILQTTVEELGRRLSSTNSITIEMANTFGSNAARKEH